MQRTNGESFVSKLTSGYVDTADKIDEFLKNNPIDFKYGGYVFLVSDIEQCIDKEKNELDRERELIQSRFNEIVEQIISEKDLKLIGYCLNKKLVYFFNVDITIGKDVLETRLHNLAEKIKNNISKFLNIELSLGIGDVGDSIFNANLLFLHAEKAQKNSFFEATRIALYTGISPNSEECPKLDLEAIKNMVRLADYQLIEEYIDDVFKKLYEIKSYEFVYDVFIDFLSYTKIIRNELPLSRGSNLQESKQNYNTFYQLNGLDAVKKYVIDLYNELICTNRGTGSGGYSYTINRCEEYIKNNYNKNITLQDAANNVQLSKSYLSLLFKQGTGINFTLYLTNYRIEKSKPLLKGTNLKMYEVAEKVGIDNPYYYSKLFKEITGVSCRDYRKGIR